jgi:hypothetical protein
MPKQKLITLNQAATFSLISIGIALVIVSAFYATSFLAILGVALTFWGAILLYIAPTKHVPLTLLNASTDTSNIERILNETNLTQKGIYLPPKSLKNIKSSLIFIPETTHTPLPKPEETNEKLHTNKKDGIFLTPPGLSLSLLFEKELRKSFTNIDLTNLQEILPKLLIENLEIAETVEIQTQTNNVAIRLTKNLLNTVCQETDTQPRTHEQIGCLLSSALACALAKTTGKPVTVERETQNSQTKTTTIEYTILEE